MSVGNVTNTPYIPTTTASTNAAASAKKEQDTLAELNNTILNPADSYVPGAAKEKDSNDKSHVYDANKVKALWDQAHSATAALRNVVMSMLGTKKEGESIGQGYYAVRAEPEKYDIEVPDDVRAEAEQMVSEDGYYGAKQTTSRLMDFAKALGGENVTVDTIEELRKGAQQGFDDVAKSFGGFDKMPDVTKKTYEALMKAFDDWKTSISAPAEVPATTVPATTDPATVPTPAATAAAAAQSL